MKLENYDAAMTAKAMNYDLLVFVNDSYANYLARRFQLEDHSLYLLTHECLHFVQDWIDWNSVDNVGSHKKT